ncbi:MAG: hypothetical protein QXN37_03225 [Candidatus Anstonellaceae archaeon]
MSFSSSGYKKEEKLLPGAGYWIKATRDCSIDVSATQYALSINSLSQGWNLIGSVGRSVKISDYAGNCKITSGPWHYDSNLAGSSNPYVYSSTLAYCRQQQPRTYTMRQETIQFELR